MICQVSFYPIKGPTVETEKLYIESVNHSSAALALVLGQLAAPTANVSDPPAPDKAQTEPAPIGNNQTRPAALLPNRDLDTGAPVRPGGYRLTDQTYAKLLARVTKDPTIPVPAGVKQDILRYYADPTSPISTKRNPEKWALVQQQLQILPTMPTRAGPD